MDAQGKETGRHVGLLIDDPLRRYGIEGMLHSLAGIASVRDLRGGTAGERESATVSFDLLIAAAENLPTGDTLPRVRRLCAGGARLLLLVDGPAALDAPWLAKSGTHGILDWAYVEPATLGEAVSDVMAGKFHLSPPLARRLVARAVGRPAEPTRPHPSAAPLTTRELQVLRLIAEGLSNKQVSRRLHISEHGVKRAVGSVLTKLDSPNRTRAVVRALENGLLSLDHGLLKA